MKMGLMKKVKCVVLGDPSVGKSSLILRYATNTFDVKHTLTVLDKYLMQVKVGENTILFEIMDSAGQQIYERIRELSFQDADIFIICFSIDDQLTFNNVGKWYYEARQHDKTVPILLVGAKRDMREVGIDSESCVKYSDAVATANMIGAAGYVECSALTNDGVKKVFDDALQMVLFPWSKLPVESTACNIL